MTPKVSVIVPVYKAETYLRRCIDSILSQTFQDFEVLLIDDGSPDKSGEICDGYSKTDARVRVFHKENGGVSSARNVGLDNAIGKYITFIDSDDWVENDYLSNFGDLSFIDNDILILQGVERISNIDSKRQWVIQYKDNFYSDKEINKIISEYELFHSGFPVAKLFCRNLILKNNIRFNSNISFHEDHLFVFEYWKYINKLKITSSISYKYIDYENNQSLSSKNHFYAESELAYNQLKKALNSLLCRWFICKDYEQKINHFVFQIRIEGLLFCYSMENKSTRLNYLKKIKNEKSCIKNNYFPYSIAGRILKNCLIYVPSFITDHLIILFLSLKNKRF